MDEDPLDLFDDPPYSEKDAGNVLNVVWLAIGLMTWVVLAYLLSAQ